MATQSDLNVSNRALGLMGANKITALNDTTKKEAIACNDNVDECKRELLRMHPWNFAIKRKKITPFQDIAVSNVTFVSANLIEVTHATASYAAGQYVTLTGIEGASAANGTWEIASVPNTTTTRLTTINILDSDYLGTYTASATDYIRRSPAFDYSYLYALPGDCLRVMDLDGNDSPDSYRIESGMILSDDSSLTIRYVYDVTDYATMDALFYKCLAHYLAYNLCDHITASDGKKNELHAYLYGGQGKRGILPQSRFVDATEDSITTMSANDWILARGSN
jgi:hypothetical protein